jgi:hypothetical protein
MTARVWPKKGGDGTSAAIGGLEALEAPTDPQSLAAILAKKDSRSG